MLRGNAKFRIQSEIGAAISTLTVGVRGISLAIVAAHFFEGKKLVSKFPQRAVPGLSPARWDRIGVFGKRKLKVFLWTKKRLIYPT